ncbi:protein FRA10AC1 isoform X5 [Prunus dulcis]|uniref:protein FRA10AC1 isoform X5 n=1 Tax=Prunus dulcis TaxID=3755 RepID=UPI0014828520|nr:protein FRA10AC1 isoform X5 [Prunus dulcis]
MASFGSLKSAIFDREARKQQYQAHILGLNAYDRHKKFVKDYVSFYGREESSHVKLPVKTDQDTLREGYRFIRSEEDDMDRSWEQRLVKRYYDKLFKEYCIADMSHYKSGKIGLRWRTEKEVVSGKGQFVCGNKHCDVKDGLASYEVNFSYFEAGENKQALVKLVTCERCSEKLHYKRRKEKEQLEKEKKEVNRRKRSRSGDDDDDDDDDDTDNEGNKERSKAGKKASISTSEHRADDDDDDFDEFLEGMFP